jgi:GNAT superfamily N-acetyltransferase
MGPTESSFFALPRVSLKDFHYPSGGRHRKSPRPKLPYVAILVVAREAEGQGVGRLLLDAAETWAREQYVKTL